MLEAGKYTSCIHIQKDSESELIYKNLHEMFLKATEGVSSCHCVAMLAAHHWVALVIYITSCLMKSCPAWLTSPQSSRSYMTMSTILLPDRR